MIILFTAVGLSVQIIFAYRRDLLIRKKSFFILILINCFLFLMSYFLLKTTALNPRMVVLLRVPILALIIFQIMKTLYFKIFKSIPVDTIWTMDISLMSDGIFNFLFWVIGLMVPIYLSFEVF